MSLYVVLCYKLLTGIGNVLATGTSNIFCAVFHNFSRKISNPPGTDILN